MKKFLKNTVLDWAVGSAVTAVLLMAFVLPHAGVDTTPIKDDADVIVPATGDSTYPVAVFCEDSNTKVKARVIPDVGIGYELVREVDGIVESIKWQTVEGRLATRYFYVEGEQKDMPAFIDESAKKCIEGKAVIQ